jgi:predicted porin/uncharacterized coiled-coil protein SlyX
MKKTVIFAAAMAAFGLAQPALADAIADLRAEIAAQKQAAAAQQARLDALEQKLAAVQQASTPAAAPKPADPSGYAYGEGLTVNAGGVSMNLYGLIDISYVHADHNAPGVSSTGPRVAWFSGNRWGITGKRPMGDSGLNVIFRLESEFESQTGSLDTAGVIFNRDAWVGVESKGFGKLTLGRQNAIGRDPIATAIYGDPYGSAAPSLEEGGYTNNNNFKQLIFYAGSATGTRMDNGVAWKKDFGNGLFAGLAYQFNGAGSTGGFSNNTSKSMSLAYAGGAYNLAGLVTTANVNGLTHKTYSFGGNVITGPLRLNAGYFHYTAEQGLLGGRKDDAYTLSAKYTLSSHVDFELGYQTMKADHAAAKGGNVIAAFKDSTGLSTTATGSRATTYASAFYHFDKTTEVYLAGDRLSLKDGYGLVKDGGKGQTELAVGLRTKF